MNDETVLVPLDGSSFGEAAVPYALSAARSLDAELELISVFDDQPTAAGWPLTAEPIKAWFEEYLDAMAEKIVKDAGVDVSQTVIGGRSAAKALEEYAERTSPELIVMSTHGRGPLSRAWLGSVADHVMRHVSGPVLLIRPDEEAEVKFTDEVQFRRIVIPLDGSRRAEESLEWATRIGKSADAYQLLRVVQYPLLTQSPYLPDTVAQTKDVLEKHRNEAEDYVRTIAGRLRYVGYTVQSDVEVAVSPASGILRYAREKGADLIAVGTHGRGGISRFILGSVADKIVRGAHAPVLITRSSNGHAPGGEGS